jgi:hypothetical protein
MLFCKMFVVLYTVRIVFMTGDTLVDPWSVRMHVRRCRCVCVCVCVYVRMYTCICVCVCVCGFFLIIYCMLHY